MAEVHQQERQVVEHVDAGDVVIEFDGVEQRGTPVEQHDIAEMEIAVTDAHETAIAAAIE